MLLAFLVQLIVIVILNKKVNFTLEYHYLFLSYICVLIIFIQMGLKWKCYTSTFTDVPLEFLVKLELMSKIALWLSPFQLNVPFRAIMLKEKKISIPNSISLSIMDLFLDMIFNILIICVFGFLLLGKYEYSLIFIGFTIIFTIVYSKHLFVLMNSYIDRIGNKKIKKYLRCIMSYIFSFPDTIRYIMIRPHKVFLAILFMISIWANRWIRILLIGLSFGYSLDICTVAVIISLSAVLAFISRIPGGIGTTEIIGVATLRSITGPEVAVSIFIIDRLFVMTTGIVFGGFFILQELRNNSALIESKNQL